MINLKNPTRVRRRGDARVHAVIVGSSPRFTACGQFVRLGTYRRHSYDQTLPSTTKVSCPACLSGAPVKSEDLPAQAPAAPAPKDAS